MQNGIERRNFALKSIEIRQAESGASIVEGYAAVFNQLSVPLWGFREQIAPGAFKRSISEKHVKALWNHNPDYPLGSTKNGTLTLSEDEHGLRFSLEPPNSTWGKDALESIRRGDVDGVSFGFTVVKDEWDQSDPNNVVRTLKDVDLIEISPTPFPAYPQTSVSARSTLTSGIDYDRIAGIIVRSQHGLNVGDEDKELIKRTIETLQGLLKVGAREDQKAMRLKLLKRRLEIVEKSI